MLSNEESLTERGYLAAAKQIIIVWISFAITKTVDFISLSMKKINIKTHAEKTMGGRRGEDRKSVV